MSPFEFAPGMRKGRCRRCKSQSWVGQDCPPAMLTCCWCGRALVVESADQAEKRIAKGGAR